MDAHRRKEWDKESRRVLIDLWPRVGSITLIAIKLGRSTSSIQTEASRRGLPRRTEGNERHRRKWTDDDLARLDSSISMRQQPDGKIPICKVADDVGRSVDAIADRLKERFGGEEALFDTIIIDDAWLEQTGRFISESVEVDNETGVTKSGKTKGGKNRECMTCRKVFYSTGPGNRMCQSCRKDSDSADNWLW